MFIAENNTNYNLGHRRDNAVSLLIVLYYHSHALILWILRLKLAESLTAEDDY